MGHFYETRTRDGLYVATIPGYSLQGEVFLNRADQIRFSVPQFHQDVTRDSLQEVAHELWLWDEDIPSAPIFAGPIWDIIASSDGKQLEVSAEGLESYFEKRRVNWDLIYNLEERGEIAWDLISRSQQETQGDLGITKGTVTPSGVLGNQTYHASEGIMILDVINEFAELKDGFDWKIDSGTRQFNTWWPKKHAGEIVGTLEYGEDTAFTRYAMQLQGKYIANDLLLTGPEGAVPVNAVDTVSRDTYGLMQRSEQYSEARTQDELVDRADYILQIRKRPKFIPTVVMHSNEFDPFNGPFNLGDVFQVVIDDGYVQYDTPMRWVGFQFSLSSQGKVTVTLYLNDLRELDDDPEGGGV